jgi:hypothetical protein
MVTYFQGEKLLIPVRPFLNMSKGGTWICLEDFTLYQKIVQVIKY